MKKTTALTADACEINAEHDLCCRAAADALQHAMRCGDLLIAAKAAMPHGSWGGWLAAHFAGSDRTARAYMRLADHRDEIEAKRQTSADLSIDGALRLLAPPRGDDRADRVAGGIDGQELFGVVFPPGITCRIGRAGDDDLEALILDVGEGVGAVLTRVGLQFYGEPTFEQWLAVGRAIRCIAPPILEGV